MKYLLLLLMPLNIGNLKSQYNIIIRNGLTYDGNGGKLYKGDIAINADTIAAIGNLNYASAKETINAIGIAVSPGFINMLSQAQLSLIEDGRSQSDIRQDVTQEVTGEGVSMGPLNESMKQQIGSLWLISS